MVEEGKKGVTIQRYKGLGEMNPDQLWDTTMNPETRTLLQVNVENVVLSAQVYLRNFIQTNALEVSTLDI